MATELKEVVLEQLGLTIGDKKGRDLYDLWKQGKVIEGIVKDFMDDCKKIMFAEAEESGTKDEKGSSSVQYDDGKGYQKQARVSVNLNQEKAIDFLRKKGLEDLITKKQLLPQVDDTERYATVVGIVAQAKPELLDNVEVVEEEDLESAIYEDKIKSEELEELVDKKVTYALVDLDKKKK